MPRGNVFTREPLVVAVNGRGTSARCLSLSLSMSFTNLDKLPGVSVEDRLREGEDAVPTLTVLTVVVLTRESREGPERASPFWMTLPIVGYAEGEWGGE